MHRSERFGFGPSETIPRCKIIITTDYGGTKDFIDDSTGFSIWYKLIYVKIGEYSGGDNQIWANPLLDSATSCLRYVYEYYDLALKKQSMGENGW